MNNLFCTRSIAISVRVAGIAGGREDAEAAEGAAEEAAKEPGPAQQEPGRREKPGTQSQEEEQQSGQTDDVDDPAAVRGLLGGAPGGDGKRQGQEGLRRWRQERRAVRAGVQDRRHL